VDDKVKCLCSKCHKPFMEKAARMKNGYQMQCPHCMKLITFDSSSEDRNIRRPLKAAREIRLAAEDAIVMAKMASSQERKREPTY
jgi:DNA-directed RNA polymerase subunit RPC12/RpoP